MNKPGLNWKNVSRTQFDLLREYLTHNKIKCDFTVGHNDYGTLNRLDIRNNQGLIVIVVSYGVDSDGNYSSGYYWDLLEVKSQYPPYDGHRDFTSAHNIAMMANALFDRDGK